MSTSAAAGETSKATLSESKRKLLEMRLRGRKAEARCDIPIRPQSENPLSFGQERIWFQCRVTTNPALYHVALLAWCDGVLNLSALEWSLNEIIRRHEVLRSGFVETDGAPRQIISQSIALSISQVDLQQIDAQLQENEVRRRAEAEAREPFDLATPPLLRVTLLTLAPQRHALLLTVHHILWDGWSSGLFIKEISRLYAARSSGLPNHLPPLPIQYGDFAYWHRRSLKSEEGRRQIAYWKKRLEGLPELSSLPTDRPRPATQRHRGSNHSWRLPDEVCAGLSDLSRTRGVTLFASLLAVFNAVLFHYTGQGDLAVGTTIAFRTRSELENLLGFFANALVLRTRLAADQSFVELLSDVHQSTLEAQANQDVPFERLVDELARKRGLSYNPLFQIAFVLHNLPMEKLQLPGLTIAVDETNTDSAAFDLVFHIFDEGPGLRARFEYDSDLFERSTIIRLASHFDSFARNVIRCPSSRISDFSLLDDDQRSLLVDGSRTPLTVASRPSLLHQGLDSLARSGTIAVSTDSGAASYQDLLARARQLGHHLVKLGVGPDVPVAVVVEPSIEMIVAILGVLEANGAYVPIDPSYPAERVAFILSDSAAVAIVTTRSAAAALPSIAIPFVFLDADATLIASMPTSSPAVRAAPDNLAYQIYTSGSTGTPKGVMVSHGAAVASTLARRQVYMAPVRSFLLLSSIAFDSSVVGVFWTLFDGGRLCIPSEKTRRDPGALVGMIEREQVSHLLCLPSFYSAVAGLVTPAARAMLECVIVAGEECRGEVVTRHFDHLPSVALFNEYGPTECTVWATGYRIERDDRDGPVSIGRPAPGVAAFVFGLGGSLLPPGVPGELYLGGSGVARGYRGRPELTAERFLPNPFAEGERLYRTGDRVRLGEDGAIIWLGRIDNQVKIRGYRVEPAEIESVLSGHPALGDCVVVASQDKEGVTKLVAYLAPIGAMDDVGDFKKFLSGRLPDHMIPETFVILESLPRLPNGKVDRAALPSAWAANSENSDVENPSSIVAALIGNIWCEILSVEVVSEGDDFFNLGGNSLTAIQVIARVQKMFGNDVPVNSIFESGTLGEFARQVELSLRGTERGDALMALLAEIET